MKLYKEEISGADKKRILFAVGIDEIKLMFGILTKALLSWPIGKDWKPDSNRLRSIVRELREFIDEYKI